MTNIANNTVAKFAVAFTTVAMLFTLAAPVQAQSSVEDLQAQIEMLLSQIADLQGGADMTMSSSDVCPYNWSRNLNIGATGMDVMKLQQFLNADAATQVAVTGAGSPGMETEYYGALTGAAVMKFQELNRDAVLTPVGLVSGTTFFGPSTRAEANAQCASAPVVDVDVDVVVDGDEDEDDTDIDVDVEAELGDGEGDIDSVSSVSPEEGTLEEGQTGGVLAFELEIEGDVEIDRIDVYASEDGSVSEDAEDYFNKAYLWVDGVEVAELDVDDWDQDDYNELGNSNDDYRLRFSNLGLVFEDGDEPEIEVALEAVGNIDSTDRAGDWDIGLESIRFVDGQGFTDTWEDNATPVTVVVENFGFDEEETAELDINEASDNPDATTLKIEEDDDESDEYTVFVFEIEEENGVDVSIEDMTFTITTTGSTTEGDVIEEAILYHGSEELASESVNGAGSPGVAVQFENLGIEIDGDETEEFSIALIFKGAEDHGNSTDVTVAFTSIDDAEDANGNDENDMTISISATSETHDLRTVVPVVSDTSFNNDRNEAGDAGTISFEFTIGAEDDDYDFGVADKNDVDGSTDDIRFTITGTDTTIATSSITLTSGDATATGSGWTIADGDEATFVMDVTFTTVNAADNGTYRVTVDTVGGIEVDETSNGMSLTN